MRHPTNDKISIDLEKFYRVYSHEQEVDMIVDSMRKYKQMAFEEGKAEGNMKIRQKIARKMLHEQMDIALIVRVTGLSEAEILELKNS